MAKRSKLARLIEDGRVRRDRRVFGLTQVGADFQDQRGDVVQQTLCWEHVAGFHWDQIHKPFEPPRGECAVFHAHALGDQISEVRDNHGRELVRAAHVHRETHCAPP